MTAEKRYRFVLSVGGKLTYYRGEILKENKECYTINESVLGVIDILKSNVLSKRDLK